MTTLSERLDVDLEAMPPAVHDSALAEAARMAAKLLESSADGVDGSVRDTAALLKELRGTLAELRALAAVTVGGQEDDVERLMGAGPGEVLEFRARGGRKTS